METRNIVFVLIVILLLSGSLLVGLVSGFVSGGLICGFCGFAVGASSASPRVYSEYPPEQPYVMPLTPVPPPEPDVPGVGQAGAVITQVVPDSPAEEAGLRPGDIIFSVDQQRLEQGQDLARIIGAHRPGDEVTLGVWRRGRTEFVRVRLAEHPEERGRGYLGIYFQALEGQGPRSPHSGD